MRALRKLLNGNGERHGACQGGMALGGGFAARQSVSHKDLEVHCPRGAVRTNGMYP